MRHDGPARTSGLRPDVAVVVATVRALKYHGGVAVPDLATEDLAAVESGMRNLSRHLHNLREVYGIPCVVAVNRFPTDTDAEMARVVVAQALARGVLEVIEEPSPYSFSYTFDDEQSLVEKAETVASRLYGAAEVTWDPKARRRCPGCPP